jgi:hypothetical protein
LTSERVRDADCWLKLDYDERQNFTETTARISGFVPKALTKKVGPHPAEGLLVMAGNKETTSPNMMATFLGRFAYVDLAKEQMTGKYTPCLSVNAPTSHIPQVGMMMKKRHYLIKLIAGFKAIIVNIYRGQASRHSYTIIALIIRCIAGYGFLYPPSKCLF